MKKIHILYCIEYLGYGGTEKQLISLIEALDRNRFQPHLCCLRKSIINKCRKKEALDLFEKIECPKIQLDIISFRKIKTWIDLIKLVKFIRSHHIDIVQTYFQDPAILGLLAGKLSNVKSVLASFRDMGFWRHNEYDVKMKLIYNLFSYYIANSLAVRNLYVNLYDLPGDKFKVIYNGVDINRFRPPVNNQRRNDKRIVVGIVANLNRQVKRLDIFLRAAAYVIQRIADVKFVIAGEGELKSELLKLSRNLGLGGNVEFLGKVEDVPRLLYTIGIGIISSDSEGFSNAILEYMAAGVPVVATDVGGNGEIIKDAENGFLVSAGDYRSMGRRIIELIQKEDIYQQIRKKGFDTVYDNFTSSHCIKSYQNFYEQVLNRGG